MTPEQESKIARLAVEWIDAQLGVGMPVVYAEWVAEAEPRWIRLIDAYKALREDLGYPPLPESAKDNTGLPKPRDAKPTLT